MSNSLKALSRPSAGSVPCWVRCNSAKTLSGLRSVSSCSRAARAREPASMLRSRIMRVRRTGLPSSAARIRDWRCGSGPLTSTPTSRKGCRSRSSSSSSIFRLSSSATTAFRGFGAPAGTLRKRTGRGTATSSTRVPVESSVTTLTECLYSRSVAERGNGEPA